MEIKKKVSLQEICDSIGEKYEIIGQLDTYITTPSQIENSEKESISFCSKKTDDAFKMIRNSEAKIIFCSNELDFSKERFENKTLILVSKPRLSFIKMMQQNFMEKCEFGISPSAIVDSEADIHPNVYVGPYTYIGKCKIMEGSIIYGHVYIYSNCSIGRNVIIHSGTVIGADGFGYEQNEDGILEKFPHLGGIVVEDDVEIGSNTSIDRGTLANTIIGKGTKIDNLCHIAHNVVIGKNCAIIAHSMIGGSVKIGDNSWIAPCACIRDGLKIGKQAVVGMGSVVTKDIGDNWIVYGVPAKKIEDQPNRRKLL